ncbi:uncharacterized protein LAESUDRAFT_812368 [Laetiporus sulphureus 93-53]|uniref:DUF6533 domain-containing protein n=1 Tax=Laetiporus sulphureus 93-53 TaxID=1314785 RepID=A0A165EGR0_9APHY|nr:uncharacterized protein LAESUDRAFT_812368 [Laetiporus sulphureus 93-53]KZT07019.1 hypothetical protein LAESUDRAFT_812368 [Laetiporus sulphureus 93-53]
MSQADADRAGVVLVTEEFNEMLLSNFFSVVATCEFHHKLQIIKSPPPNHSKALVFYDYFLTFSKETRCIWSRKLSGATLLFFVNRYLTLLYRIVMLIDILPWRSQSQTSGPESCTGVQRIAEALTICLQLNMAVFTSLRMYAIWDKNCKIFIGVLLLGILPAVENLYYYTRIVPVVLVRPLIGCGVYIYVYPRANDIVSIFNCIFAIASDAVVLTLTSVKTIEIRRTSSQAFKKCRLVALIERDGTIYFLMLLILNAVNLAAVEFRAFGCLPALTEALSSILISRFILNMRSVCLSSNGQLDSSNLLAESQLSDLYFSHLVTGNLNSPLGDSFQEGDEELDRRMGTEDEAVFVTSDPLAAGLSMEGVDMRNVTARKQIDSYYSEEV